MNKNIDFISYCKINTRTNERIESSKQKECKSDHLYDFLPGKAKNKLTRLTPFSVYFFSPRTAP